jgi:PAS domain S-box-containing protein
MLPLVLLATAMAYHEVLVIQRDMEVQAATVAENAVASIDNFLKSQIDALTVLAHSPLLQDETRWGEFHVEAMGFYRSFGAHVVVTDGKRPEQLLLSTRVPVGTPLPILKTDKFRQAGPVILETGKPAVGDLFMGVIQREPLVGIGVPVSGKPLVVGTTVGNDVFQQIVNKVSLPTDWSLFLADSVGDTIASKGPSAVVAPAKQNVANSTLSPWKLTVSIPGAAYWQPVGEAGIALVAAILGVTLVGFLGGNLTGQRLRKSVSRIVDGVGPFDVQEVLEARQKIDEETQKRQLMEATLRESQERLTLAQRVAGLGIFDHNIETGSNSWDFRTREIWGIGPTDPVGLERFMASLHPDDCAGTQVAIDKAFDPNGDGHYDAEYRVIRRTDGKERWVAVTGQAFFENGKPLRLVGTVQDITDRKATEMHLRQQAQLLDLSTEAIFAWEPEGVIEYWNSGAELLYGFSRREAVGQVSHSLLETTHHHPQGRAGFLSDLKDTGRLRCEVTHRTKDGRTVVVESNQQLIRQGSRLLVLETNRDITEQRSAREALRESGEQFRVLTQNLVSAVALVNERGEISIVNKAFLRLFNLSEDSDILNVNSRDWSQWQVFDEAGRLLEVDEHPVRKATLTRAAVRDMLVAVQCPGCTDRKWMLVSAEPLLDEEGNLQRLICTYHEITDRKQAEEKLRESEQRFRLALKNSQVLVAMQDSDLVYQWAYNTRTRRPEDVVGKTDAALFAPEDLPSILEAKSKVLQTGQVVRKGQWLTSNGQRVFLDSYYEPIRDSGGKILGIRIAAVNLTEQKRAEEALSQSEERYRALFESMSEGFALHEIVTDEQGRPLDYRFIDANPAFEKMTGLKRADVLGKRVREILPDIEAHWIDSYGRVALTGEPVHFENYSAHLEQWFAVYAYRPAPRQFAAVFTDITVRKRTEQALAKAHSQIQDIIDNTPDIVYAFDFQERFVMVNASLAALFNTTKEQMIGKRRHEFMPREDADWHETNDRQVLESGTILEFEEYSNLEDRSITWLTKKFPLRDPQGTIYAVAGISADISERKRAGDALHRLNEMLESKVLERTADLHAANQALERRASQLRELAGDLTTTEQRERKALAKLLHDGLQQYLVAARMRQSALIEDLENHAAKKSAQEIEGLLSESINVSRSLAIELCPPALDGGIMSGLEWLSRFMARKHGLDVDLLVETGAPVLPENIKVFLFESVRELLLNVVKHSKTLAAKVHLKEDRQRLQVIVSDAGVGFDVVALERRDSGAGLGLFSIRERIGLVCGSVEIDSSPGMGARITITVPIANLDTAPPEIPPMCRFIDPSRSEPDSKVRILLADDHKVVREGLAQMLGAEKDFEIVGQAADGNAAVELTGLLRPRVVLMDVGMPNMDGITATRIIAERHPEVRIIGLSFYRAEERAEEMIKAGAKLYVSKTAPAEDLKKAIRSCAGQIVPKGAEG